MPYSCNSWRCEVCRRHEAAVCFARIKEACARDGLVAQGWIFLVLTLDRNGYYSGRPWRDAAEAYAQLSTMSRKLLKRLNRMAKRRGWEQPGAKWVGVVEAHRSGWPHMNLLVYCPELAEELEAERLEALRQGMTDRESRLVSGELAEHLQATGWGLQSTAERARSDDALWGYVTKLAGEADAATGELAKITQAPLTAPHRFRRLRSGKGFLPPRRKDPAVTGCLVQRARSAEGDWEIRSLNASAEARESGDAEECARLEWAAIEREEHWAGVNLALARCGLPPVRDELILSSHRGELAARVTEGPRQARAG